MKTSLVFAAFTSGPTSEQASNRAYVFFMIFMFSPNKLISSAQTRSKEMETEITNSIQMSFVLKRVNTTFVPASTKAENQICVVS
jgi:hypothetical protein